MLILVSVILQSVVSACFLFDMQSEMKSTGCHRLYVVINLIDVKVVEEFDNNFRILMNISLGRLIVHKLDFNFGTNVNTE